MKEIKNIAQENLKSKFESNEGKEYMRNLEMDTGVSNGEKMDKMNQMQKEAKDRKKNLAENTDSFDW
jgi:uncharacterized membrane protein